MTKKHTLPAAAIALALAVASLGAQQDARRAPDEKEAFRFKSGVELINVTTTVSDASGRFVSGLRKEDFAVYEDDQPVEITHFSSERVPVSLGIVLDTSGSMAGSKMEEAQSALNRFLFDLLDKEDEIFLYRFSNFPVLLQGWTTDRQRLGRVIDRITANGGTAMYDAVAEAVPLAQEGQFRKKALVVISDGNDTGSQTTIRELKQQIRESEVLVYAIGIDGESDAPTFRRTPPSQQPPRLPIPFPFPVPGRGGRRFPLLLGAQGGGGWRITPGDDRVNVAALRDMTDDSGGRTEVVRDGRDLNPATASIADELSKQYYLGYQANGKKDGRWHSIRVEVRSGRYTVRARKGYVAS
jgi:Ca-activated chloride channel family protein